MKIAVIVNSQAKRNGREDIEKVLRHKFGEFLVTIERTAHRGHATEIARRAVTAGMDTVVSVGGDGTVNEILNAIVGRDVALGIIPTGTANDLASYYRIPQGIEDACDVILQRNVIVADAICVNGWYYFTAGGAGLPCDTLIRADALRRQPIFGGLLSRLAGRKLYLLALALTYVKSTRQSKGIRVCCNGSAYTLNVFSIIVANQPRLGESFLVSPEARNDDGMLDLFLIEDCRNRRALLHAVAGTLTGAHTRLPNVKMIRTARVTIDFTHAVSFFGDGEVNLRGKSFELTTVPAAVRIIAPSRGEGD